MKLKCIVLTLAWICLSASAESTNNKRTDTYFIKLKELSVKYPRQLLHILDSLAEYTSYPSYKIEMLRARAYHNLSMHYMALLSVERSIHTEEIRKDSSELKNAYQMLAEWNVLSHQLQTGMDYIREGEELAQQWKDTVFEANMKLAHSDIYRRMGMVNMGYQYAGEAARLLENRTDIKAIFQLSHIYGYMMAYYIEDKNYEKAWILGQQREQVILKLQNAGAQDIAISNQQGYCFSKMAYLAQIMGKTKQATTYYQLFQKTDLAKTILGKAEINNYLLETGRYDEVLANNKERRDNYIPNDTLNMEYIRILHQDSKALSALGKYKKAYHQLDQIFSISNAIRTSDSNNYMLEIADMKKALQREAELREIGYNLKMNKKIIILLLCILSLSIIFCCYIIWKYRQVRYKNQKTAILAGELIDYKKRAPLIDSSLSKGHNAPSITSIEVIEKNLKFLKIKTLYFSLNLNNK